VKSLEVDGYKFIGGLRSQEHEFLFPQKELDALVEQQLIPLIEESSGNLNIGALRSLTLGIFRENSDRETPTRPVGSWRPYSFVDDSGKIRVDDVLLEKRITTIRTDGEEHQYLESIKQANIHPSSTSYGVESRKFFLHGLLANTLTRFKDGKCAQSNNELTRIDSHGSGILVDLNTGFVVRDTIRGSNGQPTVQRLQALPIITSGKIPIPRLIVTARYFGETGHLQLLTIYVLNHIYVNRDIDQTNFVLSVPAGTTVVDYASVDEERTARDGTTRYRVDRIIKPIADVRELVTTPEFAIRHSIVESQLIGAHPWRRMLMVVSAAIVLALMVFIGVKRKKM